MEVKLLLVVSDKMSKEYIKVCKKYNCKAKVFNQMETGLKDKIECQML